MRCCNGKVLNDIHSTCCDGEVVAKEACCGDKIVDPDKEACW